MSQYDDIYEMQDKPKRKQHEDPTTWADAWKAIGIFVGSVLVIGLIVSAIQNILFKDLLNKYIDITLSANSTPELSGFLESFINAFQNPIFLTIYLLFVAAILIVGLFFVYGLIHVFATKVQKGEGTLRGLIVRANLLTTVTYIIISIVASLSNIFMMMRIVERFEGVNILASIETLTEYNQFATSQSSMTSISFLVFWLIWSIGISFISAKNYQMSKNKGCVTLLLTNVTMVVLFCGCIFAVGFGIAGFVMAAA